MLKVKIFTSGDVVTGVYQLNLRHHPISSFFSTMTLLHLSLRLSAWYRHLASRRRTLCTGQVRTYITARSPSRIPEIEVDRTWASVADRDIACW
jgi:hypothetical protein